MSRRNVIVGAAAAVLVAPLWRSSAPRAQVQETSGTAAYADVRRWGATGDGVTDDTLAFRRALASLAREDGVLHIPRGRYRLSRKIEAANKSLRIVGDDAVFRSDLMDDDWFLFRNCNVETEGRFAFEGRETLARFIASPPANDSDNRDMYAFLRLKGGTHRLAGLNGSAMRCLVRLDDCTDCRIESPRMQGFMPDDAMSGPPVARKAAAIYINGGSGHVIDNPAAFDHGSVVLVGRNSRGGRINGGTGRNLKDNGYYISSGTEWTVTNPSMERVTGTGVKMRGSLHRLVGATLTDCRVGVSVTGSGQADAEGANGRGNSVTGVTIDRYIEGVSALGSNGRLQRDVEIGHCRILNQTRAAAGTNFAAVRASVRSGLDLHDCVIDGTTSKSAVLIAGDSSRRAATPRVGVHANQFRRVAGEAIVARHLAGPRFERNSASADTLRGRALIVLSNCTDPVALGNVNPGGRVLRSETGRD